VELEEEPEDDEEFEEEEDIEEDEEDEDEEEDEDDEDVEEEEEELNQGPNAKPAKKFTVFIYLTFNINLLELRLKFIF